ncbi:MFS general substrate transporter [Coprinopsis marcescibilis]|uniref:MFS general substrate transporter n=1 Tax=Coprinopsis marcescibilis TaxID=230819 RepID=A0A5C3LD60_COPMA|nr:MFS general substrate transporter [Coprinopsis marcescibilis]
MQQAEGSVAKRPSGLEWRASFWFTTVVVGSGIAIDLLVYSIIIPVIPFQLAALGHTNVSAMTGWLLFAFSGGVLSATIPIAHFSEKYNERRWLLIAGFVILIGSMIMMMEAPNYAVMAVARVLQGVGSAFVWTVGLALLADATPEQAVGQQLGFAMIGVPIGLTLGPPLGGALYTRFGFRAPFVFGVSVAFLDLIGRLVIIERKDAIKWGFDPHVIASKADTNANVKQIDEKKDLEAIVEKPASPVPQLPPIQPSDSESSPAAQVTEEAVAVDQKPVKLSLHRSIKSLLQSSRAVAAFVISLLYGILLSSQEPSVPVHLNRVWGLNSGSVGLVFIGAILPTLIATPLAGYLTDKKGAEFITAPFLFLGIPWAGILILQSHFPLFCTAYCILSFFVSGVISPVTAELAAVARKTEGVGYAHVYSAYNMAYAIGTTIGPIVGGQMHDRLPNGWMAICLLAISTLGAGSIIAFAFIGETPLLTRLNRAIRHT